MVLCKRTEHIYFIFLPQNMSNYILRKYVSLEYTQGMKLCISQRIDSNSLANVMRQRRYGTQYVYCSKVRFLCQRRSYSPDESTKAISTKTLVATTPDNTKFLIFRIIFAKFSFITTSQHEIQSFLLSFEFFPIFNEPQITVSFLCFRLRQKSIERAMDLTDSFTWEEMPTRDADTGHLTAAGWIPRINKFSMRAATAIILFHTVQSTIRIVTNHETVFAVWYPFDWTVSPFYELVIISQVTICKTEFSSICSVAFLI